VSLGPTQVNVDECLSTEYRGWDGTEKIDVQVKQVDGSTTVIELMLTDGTVAPLLATQCPVATDGFIPMTISTLWTYKFEIYGNLGLTEQ